MTARRHWACGGNWALCGGFRGRVFLTEGQTVPRSSFMDRKSCMRREGMDARSRPAKAGIQEGGGGM